MAERLNLQEKIQLIESIVLAGTPGNEIQPLYYSLLDMLEEDDADNDGYEECESNDALFTEYRLVDILVDNELAKNEEDAYTLIGDKRVHVHGNLITNPHYPLANDDIEEDGYVEVMVDYTSSEVRHPEDTVIAVSRINIYGPCEDNTDTPDSYFTFQFSPVENDSSEDCACGVCNCDVPEEQEDTNEGVADCEDAGPINGGYPTDDEEDDQNPVIRFPYSNRLTVGEILNQSGAIPFSQQMGGDTIIVNGVLGEYSTPIFADALPSEDEILIYVEGEPFTIEIA